MVSTPHPTLVVTRSLHNRHQFFACFGVLSVADETDLVRGHHPPFTSPKTRRCNSSSFFSGQNVSARQWEHARDSKLESHIRWFPNNMMFEHTDKAKERGKESPLIF